MKETSKLQGLIISGLLMFAKMQASIIQMIQLRFVIVNFL